MIIFAASSDFSQTYPNNSASDFYVNIIQRENFGQKSQIGLLELIVPPSSAAKICYIYCSIAAFSQCHGRWQRVLRVVDIQQQIYSEKFTFANPIYFDIFSTSFENIRFSLIDEENKLIQFESGTKTIAVFDIKNGIV